jgi:flavodoxin
MGDRSDVMHCSRHPKGSGVFRMTRRTTVLSLIAFVVILLLTGSAEAQQQSVKDKDSTVEKTLIVYLSRTNNTKAIAEMIHDKVGGRLVALELEKPYPANYRTTVEQVVHEDETGYMPPLKTKIEHMEQYELVFVGFPTWGMQLPPPIRTFLHEYDLAGKTVVPFDTNGGYGPGSTFQKVRELCPRSKVLEGFTTRGGLERDGQYLVIQGARAEEARKDVETWLRRIAILK